MPFRNVVVFYGHIHQEHHHMTGHIAHHAANSLMPDFGVRTDIVPGQETRVPIMPEKPGTFGFLCDVF